MLGDEHIVEHRLGLPQADVLEGPGHAQPGDLIRGRGEGLRVKSVALALVLLFHFALGVVFDDLCPVKPHRAVGGLVYACDDIEGGGLSRAVGSDEGHDLALVDLQLQIVHSHNAAELHGDVIQSQKLLTHGCTASFCRFFLPLFQEIRQLFISHDALSEEQHHHHDDDGEHHHPEAGAQEGAP